MDLIENYNGNELNNNNELLIEKIKDRALNLFSFDNSCHDFDHVIRVHNLAHHIAKIESADLFIVRVSAYLHDIGRHEEDLSRGKICHAEYGAKLSREILADYKLNEDVINKISVSSLLYSASGEQSTIELCSFALYFPANKKALVKPT